MSDEESDDEEDRPLLSYKFWFKKKSDEEVLPLIHNGARSAPPVT